MSLCLIKLKFKEQNYSDIFGRADVLSSSLHYRCSIVYQLPCSDWDPPENNGPPALT